MGGESRRKIIVKQLLETEKPISASRFAKEFSVSRQIIVGDVALLRAAGEEIIATARGYVLEKEKQGIVRKIACQHQSEEAEEEMTLIVENGGEIIDVIVGHPIYGELVGGLHVHSLNDVKEFMSAYRKNNATMLSVLTGGIHLHTIRCQDEATLENIKTALAEKGILYEDNE